MSEDVQAQAGAHKEKKTADKKADNTNSETHQDTEKSVTTDNTDTVEANTDTKDNQESQSKTNNNDNDASVSSLQAAVDTAEAKAKEYWNRVLRMQADMDNQRKRAQRDVENAHKYALEKFVNELLPVKDSLEMGLKAEGEIETIREGMALTLKQFSQVMEKFEIAEVDPEGEKFNPELHQAMSMIPSPEHDNNTVVAVMQKGYTLNGRLVRPAMVMVCKN